MHSASFSRGRRRVFHVALGCLAAVFHGGAARAEEYPSRPITIVVPFAPGLVTDTSSRLVADHLRIKLNQPVVIENKPGAQGVIGTQFVARAPADGYTLLVATNGTHAANPALFKKLSYDPIKGFVPIGKIGTAAWALVVRADDPVQNLDSLFAKLRAKPGAYTAGYFSAASQVCISMLDRLAKVDTLALSYKANSQAVADLIGGRLDYGFLDIGSALAQAKGGKLRLLGVTSRSRSPLAPQVPALHEILPDYEVVSWSALVAPAGTPKPVIEKLNQSLVQILALPEVRAKFDGMSFEPAPGSPAALDKLIREDTVRWAGMIRDAGIAPE
jgi:tripartite-type tricarboxylate transporter receptor subunit TctC